MPRDLLVCYCVAWLDTRTRKIVEVGFYSESTPTTEELGRKQPLVLYTIRAKTYDAAERTAREVLKHARWDWARPLVGETWRPL